MTTTHDHDSTRHDETDHGDTSQHGELPPFVFVPDHVGSGPATAPVEVAQPPAADGSGRVRRWRTGHSVAAAVVAVGVLASGGAALAARDGSTGTGTDRVPGAPAGVVPGPGRQNQQAPPPGGQLPGQPGQQGQLGGPFGDHDDDVPGGQLPGSTSDGSDGSDGTTGSVTT